MLGSQAVSGRPVAPAEWRERGPPVLRWRGLPRAALLLGRAPGLVLLEAGSLVTVRVPTGCGSGRRGFPNWWGLRFRRIPLGRGRWRWSGRGGRGRGRGQCCGLRCQPAPRGLLGTVSTAPWGSGGDPDRWAGDSRHYVGQGSLRRLPPGLLPLRLPLGY